MDSHEWILCRGIDADECHTARIHVDRRPCAARVGGFSIDDVTIGARGHTCLEVSAQHSSLFIVESDESGAITGERELVTTVVPPDNNGLRGFNLVRQLSHFY